MDSSPEHPLRCTPMRLFDSRCCSSLILSMLVGEPRCGRDGRGISSTSSHERVYDSGRVGYWDKNPTANGDASSLRNRQSSEPRENLMTRDAKEPSLEALQTLLLFAERGEGV